MTFLHFRRVLALCFLASYAFSGAPEWHFVHVSALVNEASIEQGTAKIEIKDDHFSAYIKVDGQEWATLSGTIQKGKVSAKYTVLGSDYTINSPYTGTITRKKWRGLKDSGGRECIQIADGFNSITLFRELAP